MKNVECRIEKVLLAVMKSVKWKIYVVWAISFGLLASAFVFAPLAQAAGCLPNGGCFSPWQTCVNGECQDVKTEENVTKKGLQGALGLINIFGTKAGFPETNDEPEVVVGKIIQGALVVIGVIFGILIVYAGYLWMIARSNEEMIKKAIETLQTAVIGFIVVVGAYAITSYVVGKVITAAFPAPPAEESP